MRSGIDEPAVDELLAELQRSQDRLAAALAGLSEEQVGAQSYADKWSIAQVASHLGSSAEIFAMFLEAGLRQTPAPGTAEFQPVWARWNAKPPHEQTHDAVVADATLLDSFEALTGGQRAAWQLDMFGARTDLRGLLGMRLGEHAVHTWDIAVALDPTAIIAAEPAALIMNNLPGLAGRVGKPMRQPRIVHVSTPVRSFVLEPSDDGVILVPASSDDAAQSSARLRLPGEALVRLIYGRLDAEHTPASVQAEGVDLAELRATFPGL